MDRNMSPSHGTLEATIQGAALDCGAMTPLHEQIAIEKGGILGRERSPDVLLLDHPSVSRRHAELANIRGELAVRDLGSTNGTFVNGERIDGKWRVLCACEVIAIGPYHLEFTGYSLRPSSRQGNLELIGKSLSRTVMGKSGDAITILKDVSIAIGPREFVCLLGPSGSGKTTLMNALSARMPATAGFVQVNGENLYARFESLKSDIALVPQHDVLHEPLTLRQALSFSARLRLPADADQDAIEEVVEASLATVGLIERGNTLIGELSGGQKKRASLANEILNRPNLLFLDEVTSGLDEQTDKEMMELFRGMADKGMTVVCVTHTLANVEAFCHKIVFMGNGGVLAFYGTPAEAKEFFGVKRLADIYARLNEQSPQALKERYLQSALYREYVDDRLAEVSQEKLEPDVPAPKKQTPGHINREIWRQFKILAARTRKLLLADRRTLAVALGQSLFVGCALCLVFSDADGDLSQESSLVFLMGISCLWFGCNNASKEIVKERPIYKRERDVNLSVLSYTASKFVPLGVLGLIQVALLYGAIEFRIGVPGDQASQALLMALAVLAGTGMGLLISAASSSRDQATAIIPLVLIPQIVFSGALISEMPDMAEWLADWFMCGHWANEGMISSVQDDGAEVLQSALVLGAHVVAYLAAAFVVLFMRDARGDVRYGEAVKAWVADTRAGLSQTGKRLASARKQSAKEA